MVVTVLFALFFIVLHLMYEYFFIRPVYSVCIFHFVLYFSGLIEIKYLIKQNICFRFLLLFLFLYITFLYNIFLVIILLFIHFLFNCCIWGQISFWNDVQKWVTYPFSVWNILSAVCCSKDNECAGRHFDLDGHLYPLNCS